VTDKAKQRQVPEFKPSPGWVLADDAWSGFSKKGLRVVASELRDVVYAERIRVETAEREGKRRLLEEHEARVGAEAQAEQAEQQAASMREEVKAAVDRIDALHGRKTTLGYVLGETHEISKRLRLRCLSQPPTDVEEEADETPQWLDRAAYSPASAFSNRYLRPPDCQPVSTKPDAAEEASTIGSNTCRPQDKGLTEKACGGAAGEGEDAVEVIARLAPRASAGKLLSDLAAEGWKLVHAVQQGGGEDG
jgi:hypothetical protein